MSLTNLRVYQKRGEQISNQPLIRNENNELTFPEQSQFQRVRKALPIVDLLISQDQKTIGILVRIDECWKFDHKVNQDILAAIREIVKKNLPEGSDFRIVGQAALRQAVLKYTIKTALIYGILSTLICITVIGYVFKNITVTAVTIAILGLCVLWVLGLMGVLNIPLNATTSLSFGLILITTLEMIIHLVTRYNQFHQSATDRIQAAKQTVRYLSQPFFICSATTVVGFGSCMITPIPMVFQWGLVMSLGITISFCLAMILIPTVIISMKSMDVRIQDQGSRDCLSRLLDKVMNSIRKHYRLYTATGFVLIVVMLSGVPLIRSDTQILHVFGEARPEVREIRFVEANLASIHFVQLMIEAKNGGFKKASMWQKIKELETHLREIPEVVSTDSLLPLLEYVHNMVKTGDSGSADLFANPKVLPEVLFLTSFTPEGKRLIRKHIDNDFDRLRITVRINNDPSVPVMRTVGRIQSIAESVMGRDASIAVTGELVVVAAQGEDLINSEIQSMFIAIGIITILMMIQMGTPLLGLMSLIPNVPPVATVFGIMGYMGIPLDSVTVFAATVAVGLAVDNTIQFVTQLKREIGLNPGLGFETCMFTAYALAARPMASWSIVTLLGFLAMVATPFQAAASFGILLASAVFMGILGDMIFMQSMILTFPVIRKTIMKVAEKKGIGVAEVKTGA